MEDNNNIDKLFKSALDDMEMEPSATSWENVSSKLGKKRTARSKRRAGLWFSAAALLLILSYTAFKLSHSAVTAPEETEKPVSVSPAQNLQPAAPSVNSTSPSSATAGLSTPSQPFRPDASADRPVTRVDMTDKAATADQVHVANGTASESHQSSVHSPVDRTSPQPVDEADKFIVKTEKNISPDVKTMKDIAADPSIDHIVAENENTPLKHTVITPVASHQENTSVKEGYGTTDNKELPDNNLNINGSGSTGIAESSPPSETTDNLPPARLREQGNSKSSAAGNETGNNLRSENSATENHSQQDATDQRAGSTPQLNFADDITQGDSVQINSAISPALPDSAKLPDYAPQENPASVSLLKTIFAHLFVEAYYTPEMAKTRITINSGYTGPGSKNLTDYKNETSQYCFSTGVNIGYNIGDHWKVLSGVQSSTYNKTSVYNEISVIADSVYQEEFIDPPQGGGGQHHGGGHGPHHGGGQGGHGHPNPGNPGGDPGGNHHFIIHTSCGSIDLDHVPHQAVNANNGDTLNIRTEVTETIHFFNVPLLLRYSFGTKKLSYFVEAGGALNFVSRDKVQVVVDDATQEDNSLNSLNNMNYSLLFGAGANYNVYKGLGMFVMPSIRYSITPVNIDSPVNSYPYYLGISAGINFEF